MKNYYEDEEWYHILPIAFIVLVIPLIVSLKVVNLSGDLYEFWKGDTYSLDFFSYYKRWWFLVAVFFSVIMLFVKLYQNNKILKKSYYYFPMCIYIFFVIISTFLSKHPEVAKNGFVERYEGMYVLIGYIIILFVTINLVKKEKHIKVILGGLFISAIILGSIGFFQYLGYDLWKSDFGKSIMMPSKDAYYTYGQTLSYTFSKNFIYSTIYHPDYLGSYMAMLFPLCFAILILAKNKKLKIFMAFMTLLMIINLFGCNSRAGMVGAAFALMIFLVMINKYIIKHWKYFIIGFVIIIIGFGILNIFSKGALSSRIGSLIHDAAKLTNKSDISNTSVSDTILKDIKISGNKAEIVTNTETLKIIRDSINLIDLKNEKDDIVHYNVDQKTGQLVLSDPAYKDYSLYIGKLNEITVFKVTRGNMNFFFDVTSKDSIKLIDNMQKVIELKPVEKWGFEGKETLGSARGYIWSRSIPLLRNTMFLGLGPDNFAIYFPQNDILGKMKAYGDMWMLVDKPHDLYLQIALSTGIISLIAFLSIVIMYFIKSCKIYFRNDFNNFISIAGVGIFIAICGYLGAAFFNDSVISVAPVFWVLLGVGISINYMLSRKEV